MCFIQISLSPYPTPFSAAVMWRHNERIPSVKLQTKPGLGGSWLIWAEKGWEGVGSVGERESSVSNYSNVWSDKEVTNVIKTTNIYQEIEKFSVFRSLERVHPT